MKIGLVSACIDHILARDARMAPGAPGALIVRLIIFFSVDLLGAVLALLASISYNGRRNKAGFHSFHKKNSFIICRSFVALVI
jgi:hypothetical protein